MIEEKQVIELPPNHPQRMERALLSLEGLSVGDGFGECFFTDRVVVEGRIEGRHEPPPPWFHTDDTAMALSIVRCLRDHGCIDRDKLALMFAQEYAHDYKRGYGGTAHGILRAIGDGVPWQTAAGRVFDGQGSCGNGGAMRSAPIGAYFADDIEKVIEQARFSAEVTHAHPDGQAGAIAIAVAAAWAVQHAQTTELEDPYAMVKFVLDLTPAGDTQRGIAKVLKVPLILSSLTAAVALGNGSGVISSDTVPFTLWCAAKHWRDYPEALWTTVGGFGDRDTTCAIVGGIVALSAGRQSIPPDWIKFREAFTV
jgi:ADP-ribosylglycohydrolase